VCVCVTLLGFNVCADVPNQNLPIMMHSVNRGYVSGPVRYSSIGRSTGEIITGSEMGRSS